MSAKPVKKSGKLNAVKPLVKLSSPVVLLPTKNR
jgi:hypothetical protein